MKNIILKLVILLAVFFMGSDLVAQMKLRGRIADANGEALVGVNILIKGTQTGTISDLDGIYTIDVSYGDILVFSMVGMRTQEVEITDASFTRLSNTAKPNQSKIVKEPEILLPKYYDDPKTDYSPNTKNPDSNGANGIGILENKNNMSPEYANIWNSSGISVLKNIRYDKESNTYVFNFDRPLRNRIEHFEFNSSIALDNHTQLPSLQSAYSSGIPRNGSFVYTSPAEGNSFCWGPSLSQLEYSNQNSDFYPNGNIVNLGSGNGKAVQSFHSGSYLKNGMRLSNSLEYRIAKYDFYVFGRYINHKSTGLIPGSSSLGHSFNTGVKFNHLSGNAFFDWSNSKHSLYQANYSRMIHAFYTTAPEFDNTNGISRKNADKNQNAYLTSTNMQRSSNSMLVHNPYWLAANDPSLIKMLNYGFNLSYTNDFRGWYYTTELSFKREKNLNNSGFVSFFDNQNGWYQNKEDKNTNMGWEGTINKEFYIGQTDFAAYFRYILSYNHYSISNQEYFLTYSLTDGTNKGEINGVFSQDYSRAIYELVLGNYNNSNIFKLPIFYRWTVNLYHSNTCDKTYLLPNFNLDFRFERLRPRLAQLLLGRVYFHYSNSVNESDFQNLPNHFNTINYHSSDFINYSESKNVYYSNNLKPTISSTYIAGFDKSNIYKSKIQFRFEYYIKKSKNAFFPTQDEEFILIDNLADITSKGFELTLGFNTSQYNASFGFSKSSNTADRLLTNSEMQPIAGFSDVYKALVEGEEVGVIIGSRYLRNELGQLIIGTDGYPVVDSKLGIIGNPRPDWIVNFSNTLKYKQFTLEFLFEYKHGGQVWNGTKNVLNYYGISQQAADSRNTNAYLFNGISMDGQANQTTVDFANPSDDLINFRYVRYGFSGVAEDAIEDASCFRLKKLALSYKFENIQNSFLRISRLSMSFWIENLFCITPYSGVDPQNGLFGYDADQGLDLFNAPSVRRFGLNLNLAF